LYNYSFYVKNVLYLEEFIKESQYEDFYSNDKGTIYVLTIHKVKGREYDDVYMLLCNVPINNDGNKRKLYVGMTRER